MAKSRPPSRASGQLWEVACEALQKGDENVQAPSLFTQFPALGDFCNSLGRGMRGHDTDVSIFERELLTV